MKQQFTAIELENRDDCADIQAALGELTGATSVRFYPPMYFGHSEIHLFILRVFQVPRVFVNGQFIGGGTDVKKLGETGELAKLLA